MAIRGFDKIVRSVRALGRTISGLPVPIAASPAPSIGLALGGGFARGIVHVGVLKALEEGGIPVSCVAGTSVGALIGAAYCSGVSPAELEQIAARVRFKDLARWTLSRYGFATNMRMITFLNKILKVHTFEELQIPLAVTATDFGSGEGVVFRSGPLNDAVRASCAYPGVFLPVKVNGRLLVDGMLAHSLPTTPVRDMGADKVLAVSLRSHWKNNEGPRHIFDVIGQCFSIAQDMNCATARQCADLVIEPDVTGYRYDDFEHSAALVAIGEAATRAALPEIRKWLEAVPQRVSSRSAIMAPAAQPISPK
ncbi:MAG TPA: patatin-like phospholipase family protein [Terriglobales bacterium]|nr:patatin-like phospholipase family protein [Terriglobales bacterium]